MQIYGVSFDMVGKQPIVLLKTVDGNRFLPIWIGHPEAAAILMKLQGAQTPRPMTHDLLNDMLEQLDAKCERVSVTELRDNTFYASITISVNGSEIEIDSRPSDAIALAVRCQAPIFAAEDPQLEQLTPREREVLRHIARGYMYKEIAQRLGISAKTVEAHVSAVLRKLQLSSRHELSRWAVERRLVSLDGP